MAISIKDPATDALARELAKLSSTSITEAIKRALQEELARAKRQHDQTKLVDDLLQISERGATYITHPVHSSDHAQSLYDEQGLPR
jgi:antitoxin VapB